MAKVAIIGFGNRGRMFGQYIMQDEAVELVAIADTVEASRQLAQEFGVPKEMCFDSADTFFAQGKFCDAVFICTLDVQHIDMALMMPDWGSYYGYYAFNGAGNVDPYDGITCEKLENGYVQVSFDMTELTKTSGMPSTAIEFLYIRGAWTDANGEISNICLHRDDTPSLLSRELRNLAFVVSSKDWMEEILDEQIPDSQ